MEGNRPEGDPLFWFRRKRVDELREADEYLGSLGDYAYERVRLECEKAQKRGDDRRAMFLDRVRKEIARRTDVGR